ncbi:hypothetical protein DPM19_14870 [Actinomadura craniellae]|uniref:Uncharacterized protein n=1 Tax=Actinomadura craniellae TaxID=2231787 RepID=A0A365H5E9_9ACTN|nr:hypothetical protein [Actinomadura craniellae]RAY14258.1 hypothetical protein DPM19_14870 [Actinomadura craniellae]
MLFTLLFLIALAVLGPLFGADTRDSLDWAPHAFWHRRRDARRRRSPARTSRPGETTPARTSRPAVLRSEPCN